MIFFISLILAAVFVLVVERALKKHPTPFYIAAAVIAIGVLVLTWNRIRFPGWINSWVWPIFSRASFSTALFVIVMITGALPNGSTAIRKLMPIRGELSIIASILTLGHNASLFASLVEPHAAAVMGRFMAAQDAFAELPETEQPDHVGVDSVECMNWMIDYIYQHFDAFKLLLYCAQGTSYENFVHNMVEVEVESTYQYMDVLRRLGRKVPELDRQLWHIIASSMFSGMFEVVAHDMPYEKAKEYQRQLQTFYIAGWNKLMEEN